MKTYKIKMKNVHFNESIEVSYEAEKNRIVDLFSISGMFIGTYRNGKKVKGHCNDSIKIEVDL